MGNAIEETASINPEIPGMDSRISARNVFRPKQDIKKCNFKGLIGNSTPMKSLYELVEKIADTDSTILITGESGTGKELVAKIIHYNSSRSQAPFIPLICAAIPKDLLESELFGHEKGAFTGALNTRIGRFELAHNGTLFLDEIGELDPSLQVKILRVLQEKEFERVGGVKTIKIDVRILVATNKDLERAIREGKFREDLYYRLNVIPLSLPPLREKIEDIPLLVNHFVQEFAKKRKRESLTFSAEALQCLMSHRWPGNVRELENLIERLTILVSRDIVTAPDLPEKFQQITISQTPDGLDTRRAMDFNFPEYGIDINSVVENMERNLILKALEKTGGIKNRAAKLLGLNRTTLIEKMKKMKIGLQQTVTNLPNY
jgi:transcriptional regulator with GAF, ATPase, and Fis domain